MGLLSFKTADVHWCTESMQDLRERERKHAVVDGVTPQGVVAVIANQLLIVAETLIKARDDLARFGNVGSDYARPSVFLLNGLMASALIGLQGVHDAIASFCQTQASDEEIQGDIYFSTYPFHVTKFEFIRLEKQRILAHKFQNKNVNELANGCKHDLAWLGMMSINGDVYNDIVDTDGCLLLRDVLIPVYDVTAKVLQRLGSMYQHPVSFPCI